MIPTYNEDSNIVIRKLFASAMPSDNELQIIRNFITHLEEYINHNGLCSDAEYPFTIIGENTLHLSPLGISPNHLVGFFKTIRYRNEDCQARLTSYLKILENPELIEQVKYVNKSNATFIIDLYTQNSLHIDILSEGNIEALLSSPDTPLEVKTLIEDPSEIYCNVLNAENTKNSSNEYSYWDL